MMFKEFGLYPRSSEESLKSFNPDSNTFICVIQKTHSQQGTNKKDYCSNPLKKIIAGTLKLDDGNRAEKKRKMQGDLNLNQKGLISLGGERDVKDDAQLLQPNPELVMMPRGGGRERDDLERAVQ